MNTLLRLSLALLLALFAAGSYPGPSQPLLGLNEDPLTDPSWSSTVLLLHMDGADGSSTWTDSTGRHTVTYQGTPAGPVLTTASPIFAGSASGGATTHASQWLAITGNMTDFSFGTGDFTVEMWMYGNTPTGTYTTLFSSQPATAPGAYGVWITAHGDNGFSYGENWGTGGCYWYPSMTGTSAKWNHVAFVRASGVWYLYYNGAVQTKGGTPCPAPENRSYTYTTAAVVGRFYTNSGDGNMGTRYDELRITKGVARYTSNFIPRRSAFPNS